MFDLFKVSARDAILDAIRKERENEVQDRDLLKEAIAVRFVFSEVAARHTYRAGPSINSARICTPSDVGSVASTDVRV